jgi:outer membrane lipoprotein-sorting protein
MLRIRVLSLAILAVAVATLLGKSQQEPDLKAVIKKAIEAHGGEKNIDKYKAAVSKFKGTIAIGPVTADVIGETTLQKPDKVKNVMNLDIGGKKLDLITVFNGKKLWVNVMGQTKEVDDEKIINAAREELQTEGAGGLSDFLKAPYELNALGESKVKGKDAIGIRVSKKGQKDINMFFDKKTGLVVKSEMRTLDGMTMQEVTQEKFILDYQDKNGMKIAKRVEIVRDGKTFMDIEITDVQALEKIDDSVFAKP